LPSAAHYQLFAEVERGVPVDGAIAGVAAAEDADPSEPARLRRVRRGVAHGGGAEWVVAAGRRLGEVFGFGFFTFEDGGASNEGGIRASLLTRSCCLIIA
jgi:hypothetical protein